MTQMCLGLALEGMSFYGFSLITGIAPAARDNFASILIMPAA